MFRLYTLHSRYLFGCVTAITTPAAPSQYDHSISFSCRSLALAPGWEPFTPHHQPSSPCGSQGQ